MVDETRAIENLAIIPRLSTPELCELGSTYVHALHREAGNEDVPEGTFWNLLVMAQVVAELIMRLRGLLAEVPEVRAGH